jgi:hypothetical protein
MARIALILIGGIVIGIGAVTFAHPQGNGEQAKVIAFYSAVVVKLQDYYEIARSGEPSSAQRR